MKINNHAPRLWAIVLSAVLFLTTSTSAFAASSSQHGNESHGFAVFVLICLGIIIVGTTFHVQERMNIFIDYTDALVTAGSFIMPFLIYVVSSYFFPEGFAKFLMRASFVVGIGVVVRSSWIHNPTPQMAALSILTKYATACLFAASMALLMCLHQDVSRKSDESDVSYELRKMQASHSNARIALLGALVAAFFGWFCTKVSRRSNFGPIGPYFATDFHRLPSEILFSPDESDSDHTDDAASAHEGEQDLHEEAYSNEDPESPPVRAAREPLVILGLDDDATDEEIEERYRELLKKYHPDKVSHLGEEFAEVAHEKIIELQKAYDELRTH